MAQTARQIIVNNITPGSITSGTVTVASTTVHYLKVGKLYFGFYIANTTPGFLGNQNPGAPISDITTPLASALGITIAATYTNNQYSDGMYGAPITSSWTYTPPSNQLDTLLVAILST